MKIDFKRVLLAGTAIFMFGAASAPGDAFAQCVTLGAIAADCDFTSPATTGAITLNDNVDITFTSATSAISISNTIDATNLGGGSSILTGANGTIVNQTADIGATTAINAFTLNSGDFWYASASTINLTSSGTFTISGGTLTLLDGGSVDVGSSTFAGSASVDTIIFGSASVPSGNRNIIYASSFDLAGGNDLIDFIDGDGVLLASTFSMGAGNDIIRFSSGHINSYGAFGLGAGDDSIIFGSSTTSSTGLIEGASFDAGDGNDALTFWDGGFMDFSSANGTFTLGAGNDTITFNSTSNAGGAIGGSISVGTGTFDLGTGNDTVTFNSGGAIIAGTFTGGTGTDTINFNSSTFSHDADTTGVEAINVNDAALTLGGSVTGGTITLNSASSGLTASSLTIDDGAAGVNSETVTAAITGGAGAQTVTITNGTVSGAISLGADNDTLTYSSGSLTGAVAMGTGTDVLNVGAGASVAISNAVSGVETVTIQGNTLTLSAAITGVDDANDSGVNVGTNTLEINSGGSIDGAIHGAATGTVDFGANGSGGTFNLGGILEDLIVTVTSGTLSTNGFAIGGNVPVASMTVAAGSTVNAGDNISIGGALDMDGTMNIDYDSLVSAATIDNDGVGTYDFAVFSSASALVSGGGLTATGGNVDLSGGETITFSIAAGSGVVQSGDTVVFASAPGNDALAPAAWTDSSFLFDFVVADTGAALTVTVNQTTTLASASSTANNLTVATVLLTDPVLVASTDTNVQALQGAVQSAATREAFNDALEQAQPTIDGSHMVAALAVTGNTLSITNDRLASLRRGDRVTGMNTGNLTRGVKAWSQVFGVTGQQDRRDNIDGYDFDTFGMAFGADTENLGEDTVVGLGFSYANTNADSENGSRTETDIDSYQFTVYADHDIDPRTYVSGMFAYTMNNVETSRAVAAATAQGDFDANQYTTRVELGRDFGRRHATITPNIMGHWTHYDADGYTETGAGGAGLTIDSDAMDVVELGVGVDASWLYRNSDGSYFSPDLSAGYRYDFADDKVEMTSQFIAGGQAFQTEGFDAQQHAIDLGAGFTYYSTENWEFITEYDYEWKEDFDSHAGLMRANYRF